MQTTRADATGKKYRVRINEDFCMGCCLCVGACPGNSLELSNRLNAKGYRVIEFKLGQSCSGCCNCALMCPDAAIEIVEND